MAEEIKNIRLNKVTKEFNIGLATAVEFLSKKGYKVENNPNTKISDQMYQLFVKEYQSDKNVKEEAKKIGLEYQNRQSLSIENIEKEKVFDDEDEMPEFNIKNMGFTSHVKKAEVKTVAKTTSAPVIEPTPEKTESEKIPKTFDEPEVIEENATITEPDIPVKEDIEEKIPEIPEIPVDIFTESVVTDIIEEQQPSDEDNDAASKIKVVGKVDLSKLNTKTKPDKKSKEERELERERKKAELKKQKEEQKQKQTEEIVDETIVIQEEPIFDEAVEHSAVIESIEETTEQKQDNFIETRYEKLEGPKILNKIDLSKFEKPEAKKQQPVASSSEVKKTDKKRPRIKEKNKVVENINAQAKKAQENKKTWKKEDNKKKKDFKPVKPEVNEDEIEKQIKETLARLNPLGKSKASKYRREKRSHISEKLNEELKKEQESKKVIKVTEFVTANELATMMNVPVTSVISTCMSLGMFVSINQRLDAEALSIVADEFGYKIDFVSVEVLDAISEVEETDVDNDLVPRAPIVAVMGHVDHGKTSLLDYIRQSNVIAGEAGGITQHIGAYEVKLESGKKITFLDTPGHEAFTAMRARGAKITDVAIIVIACDDKIMPQTVEAINHAQAANVPIVFAINKIDKPNANPEKIKEELSQMNILVEDWGGKYQSQEISAKKGINVDLLLEKVLLEAELLDLKANPDKKAMGTVIESSLDKGRGYVAKILVQNGSIKIGDVVLAGSTFGRVKAMYNERNILLKTAGPSAPVLLLGLNGAPQAGDKFNVMVDEREAKEIANKRLQLQREQGIRTQKHITLDEIGRRIAIGEFKQLNIIVKGDVDGSVEALSDSLLKLSTNEVQVQIIHKSVGQITESDVLLASASDAIIIGFQVRPSVSARKLAEQEQIDIRLYSIIYNAINEIKAAIEGMLSPDIEEKIICNIEIREIFKISKVGTIAGCMVLDGKINRSTKIRIIRDGIVVYTGRLGSLKRFKDDVKEVAAGFECGLNIENFNDIKVGDIVEGYEQIEIKRKL